MHKEILEPIDVRFTLLASQAAISLDNATREEEVDYSPIESLSIYLKDRININSDSIENLTLYKAIRTMPGITTSNIEELKSETLSVAEKLSRSRTLPKTELKILRDYCCELEKISIEDSNKYLAA